MSKEKRLCIVGGARGLIGSHLIKRFSESDQRVVGLDRVKDKEFSEFYKVDLASEQEVVEIFHKLFSEENFSHVTLINCQGIADPVSGDIKELKLATWRKYMDVNVNSFFITSRELLRYSDRFEKASIINLSSTRRFMAEKNTEAYCASKGAILSFTKALAMSCDDGRIRVNSVSPGWIDKASKEFLKKDEDQHPVNRVGTPEDIYQICQYLSSDGSGFVTGQDFIIDGGMTTKMIYE